MGDAPLRKKSVIVADDYDDAAPLLAMILEENSAYEARVAKDGVEALDLALASPPDAAILDIDMPRMNGIDTARAMRRLLVDRRLVLIAATAGTSVETARQSGFFDHVFVKPYDVDELLRLLPDDDPVSIPPPPA